MGKRNQSELAAQQVRLEQDEVWSKYPTYVAVAVEQEQQKLDKAIDKGLDKKLRVQVLSPAEAQCDGGDRPHSRAARQRDERARTQLQQSLLQLRHSKPAGSLPSNAQALRLWSGSVAPAWRASC